MLALLLSVLLLSGTAFADNWDQVASDGISGGFAQAQNSVTSMAVYGSVPYAGTEDAANGCQIWAYTGGTWVKVREGGFGDRDNIIAKNMAVFNSKLFVGTGKYSTGAEVWSFDGSTWSQANTDGFGNQKNVEISSLTVFNNNLYAGTKNNQNGAEVWKYNSGTSWTRIAQSGFGDITNIAVGALFGYGSDLFAGTTNTSAGAEIWRYNSATWTQSVGQSPAGTLGTGPGFGGGNENPSVSTMAVYNGKLYAGIDAAWDTDVWVGPIPGLASQAWARLVWYFDGTSWKSVPGAVAGGGSFGGPTFSLGSVVDESITSMGVYGSTLVVGTKNELAGCEIYANNGTNWTLLNEPGFGDVQNKNADSLAVSGANLVIGTRNLKSGAETWAFNGSAWTRLSRLGFAVNNNYSAGPMLVAGGNLYAAPASKGGAELWQYNGTGWAQKGSEGFGDIMNQQVSSMVLWNSNIILGTRNTTDGGEVYRYDGATFTQINKSGFISTDYWYNDNVQSMAVHSSALYAGVYNETKFDNRTPGCRIYKYSGSGTSWDADISSPGFGDHYNTGAPSMISFNNVLYVGTYNPLTGCEIWQKSGSTWKQINKDGFGNSATHSASAMAVMGGKLYVATSGSVFSVWRFDGGTTWTKVAPDNFGETGNSGIASLAAFGNVLYAGTNTGQGVAKVWRYDGSAWERAANPGLGTGNSEICSLAVYDSKIFAGTTNSSYGCEVWSSLGPPGSIQSISPVKGSQGQTLDVTINGNGTRFDTGSVASFSGSGITVNSTTFKTATQVVANITIDNAAAPGKRDVNVVTGDDTPKALTQAFTVLNPRITAVSPKVVKQGRSVDLTVTGADTSFNSSSQAVIIGTGVTVLDTDYVSPTQVKVSIDVADSASVGPRGLNVNTPGMTTDELNPAFSVGLAPPRLDSVSPGVAYVGEEVTLKGEWFDSGSGSSSVTFNGKPATYIPKWTDNVIVAAVPQGATSGPVVVKTEVGTSASKYVKVVNTKPGAGVSVEAGNGVNVLFALVTGAGNTLASVEQDPVVSGFTVIPGSTRDVTSTADYSGEILVTFRYSADLQRYQQEGMVVLHEEGGDWVDVTVDRNIDDKTITGKVNSLSRFVLAIPGDVTVPAGATWYLAEGSTAYGFDTYISIQNPNPRAVTASVTYMTDTGPVPRADIPLPAMSQTTLFPSADIGNRDFSTKVQCLESETIAVDRTMTWTGQGAASPEAHSSIGVSGPNNLWYLPEGSSDWGFETWLLIQNPNDAEAACEVTYMIEDEGPKTVTHNVAANSRDTFNMETDIGKKDASIMVECPIPVIAERAMYRNSRREGHDSVGATEASNNYFLAEGTTAWGFTTYVLVQNPNDEEVDMSMTFMTDSGPVQGPAMTMDPNSRETFRINDVMPNRDFSTQVTGSLPIIAERAMYWDNGTGEACHDSIGETGAHTTFFLPDGQSTIGFETWTLVQNPNDTPVEVEITYMTPTGTGNIVVPATIPTNSRQTFNMGADIMNVRAGVMVTCKTPGQKIMVERAMYWNNKGGGTSTIGGYTD